MEKKEGTTSIKVKWKVKAALEIFKKKEGLSSLNDAIYVLLMKRGEKVD
jgi:hypothetical protein